MKRMGRKRIASALLALVMVLALLPVSLMASASEILADVLTADPPGVSVSWKAGEITAGERGVVHLSAELDPEQVTEASVTIQLEEAEANALQAELLAGGPSYSAEEKSLSFTLNSEASSLDADLVFLYPSGQENDFTVDVTDDISVTYTAVSSPDGLPDGSDSSGDPDTEVEPSPDPGNPGEDETGSTQEVRPQIQITAVPLTISAPAPIETDDGALEPQNDPAGSGDSAPDETSRDWTVAVSSGDTSVLTVTEGEDGTTVYTVQNFSFTAVMTPPPTVGEEEETVPPLEGISLALILPEGLTLPSAGEGEGAGTYTFNSDSEESTIVYTPNGTDPETPITTVATLSNLPESLLTSEQVDISCQGSGRFLTISFPLEESGTVNPQNIQIQFHGDAFNLFWEAVEAVEEGNVSFSATMNFPNSSTTITSEPATLPLLSQEEPEPEPEPNEIIITDSREEGFFQTVVWADNNNADTSRPTTAVYQGNDLLWFSIGGREWVPLTQETMAQVGLTEVPLSVTPSGTNYTVSVEGNTLPSHISVNGISYGVDWQLRQPEVEDYLIHTPEDTGDTDWYYVKETNFTATVNLRSGDTQVLTEEELRALLVEQFTLYFHYGETYGTESLERILEQHGGQVALEATEDGAYQLSVTGLRAYTTDNQPIEYSFAPAFSSVILPDTEYIIPTTLEGIEGLEEGDSLSLSYTNAQTPNHGTDTDRAYNGGTLTLTLSGSTSYSAHKQWLDTYTNQEAEGGSGSTGGDAGDPAEPADPDVGDNYDAPVARPTVEYELWRYVAGQSYLSAAPVRDSTGNIMTLTGAPLQTQDSYSIEFGLTDDDLETLPKYDQDGNRYIYVVREYLTYEDGGLRYNQVFGTVDGDNNITQDPLPDGADEATEGGHDRQSGDTFLYNEKDGTAGTTYTLSNQVTTQETVTGTKEWKASAY